VSAADVRPAHVRAADVAAAGVAAPATGVAGESRARQQGRGEAGGAEPN
jgi:hypothetical protein